MGSERLGHSFGVLVTQVDPALRMIKISSYPSQVLESKRLTVQRDQFADLDFLLLSFINTKTRLYEDRTKIKVMQISLQPSTCLRRLRGGEQRFSNVTNALATRLHHLLSLAEILRPNRVGAVFALVGGRLESRVLA